MAGIISDPGVACRMHRGSPWHFFCKGSLMGTFAPRTTENIMARRPQPIDERQRRLQEGKKQADQNTPFGKQAHEFAQRAHMKRQQKKMHQQDGKR
jgi:hypothetical protein